MKIAVGILLCVGVLPIPMILTGCGTPQPSRAQLAPAQSAVEKTSPTTLTVWSKGTVVIPGRPEQWIALSGGTLWFSKCEKGTVCGHLRAETQGTAEWTVDDPSILELTPTQGVTVAVKPLGEGQFRVVVRADGVSTKLSGRVTAEDWAFGVTMSGE